MGTLFQELENWVKEVSLLTKPEKIHWCDGSIEEQKQLTLSMLNNGTLMRLNPESHPNCYLHRSHPSDVARTEHLTFVCSQKKEDAGPNNNWMIPEEAKKKMNTLFSGAMKGRTLYVIPYCMGPLASNYSRCGVEITDSPYVVLNMRIMARIGKEALQKIEREKKYVKGLHSLGDLNPDRRFVMHFPEEAMIQSIGSGYGGNALLGKKCHALRIASWQAEKEGWLAEHMLILGIENPRGETTYVAAAFPSACGKTNLAMLIPPEKFRGYKIHTVGDDICWMNLGKDGRLWAINPEDGFFGVAPGTGEKTNPNALRSLGRNTIYTNVALTKENTPWWEGLTKEKPEGLIDWQGRPYDPANGPAAHANSRFTVSTKQCPVYSQEAENPQGVPISAIIFGGRRAKLAPLVYESRNWAHGVMVGASMASETTAAATGQVGIVRRDPMAMKPFCGYHFGDYWQHWLSFGKKSDRLPKIFHVNWFRQDQNGKFMWPGFGDNLRVLNWIIDRSQSRCSAKETPIGFMPDVNDLDWQDLNLTVEQKQDLLAVNKSEWITEMEEVKKHFEVFSDRMPKELWVEHQKTVDELK